MEDLKMLLKGSKKHMMTGVSYMIPFVVAGGVLLALAVMLSGEAAVPDSGILADISTIGIAGLGLMVPILSGYIAFSMVDRPGIAPGIIGGVLANEIGAGFLGGMISGLLAGIVVHYLKKIKVGHTLRSVMPIFIIPLIGTLIVGGLMLWVIGYPIAGLMDMLMDLLNGMEAGNLVILGLIIGAMIAFDMGGPINKVAFGFGSALVGTIDPATGMPSETALLIMAAIGVAICTPPLGMGLASLIAPKKFTTEERNSGKAALIMGSVGITEGAIPFAANDPLRVIPSNMVGAMVGACLAIILGAGNPAPWGGFIVLPVAERGLMYFLAAAIGAAVTAIMVILLKKEVKGRVGEGSSMDSDEDFDFDLETL